MNKVAGCLSLALLTAAPSWGQAAAREVAPLPSLAPLVESVKAAVVNVDVQQRTDRRGESVRDDLFEHFFGGRPRSRIRQGTGSGFIIDPKGLLLTNNHVVDGAVAIRVRLDDGRAFDAQVLGRDPLTDLALLRLKGRVENLPVVKLGDSDSMRVGDWVLAIGNPFGLASSVSAGIISARARKIGSSSYDDFLQTDAAINPGNSGGPLFNLRGEVIGINTAIVGGGTGIGFAVPSSLARALLPQLEKDGTVTRGWLGIGIQDLTPEIGKGLGLSLTEGAIVTTVNEGSPARKAGLREDDVIIALDGDHMTSGSALTRAVGLRRPNSVVVLTVVRGGQSQEIKVTLGTRPDFEGLGVQSPRDRPRDDEVDQKRIGLAFEDMDPRLVSGSDLPAQGAIITEVATGSPAERAELNRGMVVVEAGRRPVRSARELLQIIRASRPGSTLMLRVHLPSGGRQWRALELP